MSERLCESNLCVKIIRVPVLCVGMEGWAPRIPGMCLLLTMNIPIPATFISLPGLFPLL